MPQTTGPEVASAALAPGRPSPPRPLLVTIAAAGTALLAAIPLWGIGQIRAGQWLDIQRVDGELYGAMWRHPRLSLDILAVLAVILPVVGLALAWGSRRARVLACGAFVASAYGLWHRGLYAPDPNLSNAAAAACILLAGLLALSRGCDPYFSGAAWRAASEGRAWTAYGQRIRRLIDRVPLTGAALMVIAIGVVLRVATIWSMDIWADGGTYSAMGKAWMEHHEFLMPYGDVTTWIGSTPGYSHHYPPMYPLYLGLVYTVIGFGVLQTKIAAVTMALAALTTVYFTSASLFGRGRALLVTSILAVEPHLIWSTGTGFSENLVLLLFAVTLWAILKSLEKPPYILAAGAAAGLAYLTRSSIGPFFVVAGVGGLLWRFHFLGWRVLTNRWYVGAIAVFAACVAVWADRNVRLFGGYPPWDGPGSLFGPGGAVSWLSSSSKDMLIVAGGGLLLLGLFWMGRPRQSAASRMRAYWLGGVAACAVWALAWAWTARNGTLHGWPAWETAQDIASAGAAASAQPDLFAKALGYKSLLFTLYLLWYAAFLFPQLGASLRRIREEREMALWLAVGLVFVIAWVIASQLWVVEKTLLFWFDNHRYVVIAFLPLLWLALGRAEPHDPATKGRVAALALTLLLFSAYILMAPTRTSTDDAVQFLDGKLQPGMELALDGGTNKYAQFTYMPTFDVRVDGYEPGLSCNRPSHPDFLIVVNKPTEEYVCYHEIGRFVQNTMSGSQVSVVMQWGAQATPSAS